MGRLTAAAFLGGADHALGLDKQLGARGLECLDTLAVGDRWHRSVLLGRRGLEHRSAGPMAESNLPAVALRVNEGGRPDLPPVVAASAALDEPGGGFRHFLAGVERRQVLGSHLNRLERTPHVVSEHPEK